MIGEAVEKLAEQENNDQRGYKVNCKEESVNKKAHGLVHRGRLPVTCYAVDKALMMP